jgi:hypothetical protein
MSNTAVLKNTIMSSLDSLPAASLETLAEFTMFLREKSQSQAGPRVVRLRGLWSKVPAITEEEITEARRELWGRFGDREI